MNDSTENSSTSTSKASSLKDDVVLDSSTSTVKNSNKNPEAPPKKKPSEQFLYRKCRKHLEELCKSRKYYDKRKNKSLIRALEEDESVWVLTKYVSPSFALKLQSQINVFKKKARYRKWKIGEKIAALPLYMRNPTNYKLMRRLFCLPAPSKLKSVLNQFDLKEGINKHIFQVLKKGTRGFFLLFDVLPVTKRNKISLNTELTDHDYQSKQTATNALVFMLAGITKCIKQPIAYYLSNGPFTAERLMNIIKEVLHECFKMAINVRGILCKMDEVNQQALSMLGASIEKPYFEMDDKEVVCMFDPQHLIILFRNMLMEYDIKYTCKMKPFYEGTGIAKWSHLQTFYEHDHDNPEFSFAPFLTRKHVYPNAIQKRRVQYAEDIMNNKVMMGVMTMAVKKNLPEDANITGAIILKMYNMVTAFNSDSSDSEYCSAPMDYNLSHKSPHLKFFKEMKVFFNELELIDYQQTHPYLEGWFWTLNAVESLWEIYRKKRLTKSIRIPTRRLRLQPLRDTFKCIKAYYGAYRSPSASKFIEALKTTILTDLRSVLKPECGEFYEKISYEPAVEKIYLHIFEVSKKEKESAMYEIMFKEMNKLMSF